MDQFGYIGTILSSIIAYLIGSISWSILISKIIFKKDIRNYYSKNAGATNATRVMGARWGIIIMILDMIKVPLSMVIALGFASININSESWGQTSLYICGLFAIIGHCFPVFFRFKGGKGVSCFIGLTWMINPFVFLIFSFCWWLLFLTLKRVSLASIAGALIASGLAWIPEISMIQEISISWLNTLESPVIWFNHGHYLNFKNYADNIVLINIVLNLSGIILILMHYQNIFRLIKWQENKFSFRKKITE